MLFLIITRICKNPRKTNFVGFNKKSFYCGGDKEKISTLALAILSRTLLSRDSILQISLRCYIVRI